MTQNKFTLPVAIVIAGALIAGAIFITKNPKEKIDDSVYKPAEDIVVASVTAKDHILGNLGAPIVWIEYSDTECPYCKSFHNTMHQVMDSYGKEGKIAWVYRHFPILSRHPKAQEESEATECANELGGPEAFWKYLDKIYEITPSNNGLDLAELPKIAESVGLNVNNFNTCLQSGKYTEFIKKSYEEALKAGGRGTPHSILVLAKPASAKLAELAKELEAESSGLIYLTSDKRKFVISGALPYNALSQVVETILSN